MPRLEERNESGFENSTCEHMVGFASRWVPSHLRGWEGRKRQKSASLSTIRGRSEGNVSGQGVLGRFISLDTFPLNSQKKPCLLDSFSFLVGCNPSLISLSRQENQILLNSCVW